MSLVVIPMSGALRDAFNPLVGLNALQKSLIDFDVEKFENSGNANVLDPSAQAWIQGRLMDVPGVARWTDYKVNSGTERGYDTWQNLFNRVRYRIQDAAPNAETFVVKTQPSQSWSNVLSSFDAFLGRERTNAVIGYAPPPAGSPAGTPRLGENPLDPANRGAVDGIMDKFGDWLPWIALGVGALAVIVIIVAVRK